MMTTLSSLVAAENSVVATSGDANDDEGGIITTLDIQ